MTQKDFEQAVRYSRNKKEAIRAAGLPGKKSNQYRLFDKYVQKWNIDTSHFLSAAESNRRYNIVNKTCPVCQSKFDTLKGHVREKTTCSHSCSNTYFRSGENHGNWNENSNDARKYRKTCFDHYGEACLLCGWVACVEVHHLDRNRDNNKIENLIPLCPNHHKMIHHPDYEHEIIQEIKGHLTG